MKSIFLLLFTNIIVLIFNTSIAQASDKGITFKAQIETIKGEIIEFSGCSKDNRNEALTFNDPNNSNWGIILKKSQISEEYRVNNWALYEEFFSNCKEYKFDTVAGLSQGTQNLKKCSTSNKKYFIPKDISTWTDFCSVSETNVTIKSRGDNNLEKENNLKPEKKTIKNKFADKTIDEVLDIFNEGYKTMEIFLNGDYQKLKARQNDEDNKFSDETLIQKKADIENAISYFKKSYWNTLYAIDQINEMVCTKNECSEKIKIARSSDKGYVFYMYEKNEYYEPIPYQNSAKYMKDEDKFISQVKLFAEIYSSIDELLTEELQTAQKNEQIKQNKIIEEEKKKKKEEDDRKKAEEDRKKEEEQRKKDEKEKNDKIKKKFNDIISSLENLENDTFLKLSERIQDLSNIDISDNLDASLKEINDRIQQEESIRKEISSLVKKYKQQSKKLESQDFARLQLPVFEQLDSSSKVLVEIEQLSSLLDKKLDDLKNKKNSINKKINSKETWGTVFNILFYVILILIVGIVSFLSYRFGKKSSNLINVEKSNTDIRELNLKIKLLEEQNNNLEKIISKNLANKKDSIAEKSKYKSPEVKEVTEEEIKAQQDKERSMAYDDALENPNLISKFVDMYGVIGLDKAVKVAKGENAFLKRDDKAIERSNFWGMPNPNPKNTSGDQWIIFPGRTLQSNAAALIADDSRYGRELLNGIFKFEVGSTFRVIGLAIAIKEQDGFRIVSQGNLVLPK